MLSVIQIILILSSVASSVSIRRYNTLPARFFGIRGGGLFGKGGAEDEIPTPEKQMYPAMSNEEVEEWLTHIPVFAVTDSNGAGVVLKPDNQTSVFYFFMSSAMANATLQQLKGSNENLDLRVSPFSLGKIWFNVLRSDKKEVKLQVPGNEDSSAITSESVEYRLVPDTRDLLGARMLLTMDGTEGEALKNGEPLSQEVAQKAIKKAMTSSPKFNTTYDEIPIFLIQQMRIQKQAEESEGEAQMLVPMYFSLQNMVQVWQQFTAQSEETKGMEPAINLMDLFELVGKMQEESEIDFRNVLLVPTVPTERGDIAGAAMPAPQQPTGAGDEQFKMPGATLGDI